MSRGDGPGARAWWRASAIEDEARLARQSGNVIDLAEAIPRVSRSRDVTSPFPPLDSYPDTRGDETLRHTVAERENKKYATRLAHAHVLVTAGATEGIFLLLHSFLEPGDLVLVQEPALYLYRDIAENHGARVAPLGLSNEEGGLPVACRSRKPRVCVLHSPSNPTGEALSADVLERMTRWAIEQRVVLILDQVYDELVFEGSRARERQEDLESGWLFKVNSVSKNQGLPGLRVGWIVGSPDRISMISGLAERQRVGVSPISQITATTVLQDPVGSLLPELSVRRAAVQRWLRDSAGTVFRAPSPQGGVCYWLEFADERLNAKRFARHAFEHHQVWVLSGDGFWHGGSHSLRLSFGNLPDRVEEGLRRLELALQVDLEKFVVPR